MKETGMTLDNLKKYIDYWNSGTDELDNLLNILYEHRRNVKASINMYEDNLTLIEDKIRFYEKNRSSGNDQDLFEKYVEDIKD